MFSFFDKRKKEFEPVQPLHDGRFYKQIAFDRSMYPEEAEDLAEEGLMMVSHDVTFGQHVYTFAKVAAFKFQEKD